MAESQISRTVPSQREMEKYLSLITKRQLNKLFKSIESESDSLPINPRDRSLIHMGRSNHKQRVEAARLLLIHVERAPEAALELLDYGSRYPRA